MESKIDTKIINRLQWWVDSTEKKTQPLVVSQTELTVEKIFATWRKFYQPWPKED